MQTRIAWAVVLFTLATAATARIGAWVKAPMLAPISALIVALVGAVLIGLAPSGSSAEEVAEKELRKG